MCMKKLNTDLFKQINRVLDLVIFPTTAHNSKISNIVFFQILIKDLSKFKKQLMMYGYSVCFAFSLFLVLLFNWWFR